MPVVHQSGLFPGLFFPGACAVSASGQKAASIDVLFVKDVGGGVASGFGCLFLIGLEAMSMIA
jgi:hypothetical protein